MDNTILALKLWLEVHINPQGTKLYICALKVCQLYTQAFLHSNLIW